MGYVETSKPLPSYQPEVKRNFLEAREGNIKHPLQLSLTFSHTVSLHHTQEFDNNLGAGPNKHLALSCLLCIVDGVERIIEDTCSDHIYGLRFSTR